MAKLETQTQKYYRICVFLASSQSLVKLLKDHRHPLVLYGTCQTTNRSPAVKRPRMNQAQGVCGARA